MTAAIKISQSALSSSTYTDYYSGINNSTSSHASDYSLNEKWFIEAKYAWGQVVQINEPHLDWLVVMFPIIIAVLPIWMFET